MLLRVLNGEVFVAVEQNGWVAPVKYGANRSKIAKNEDFKFIEIVEEIMDPLNIVG